MNKKKIPLNEREKKHLYPLEPFAILVSKGGKNEREKNTEERQMTKHSSRTTQAIRHPS